MKADVLVILLAFLATYQRVAALTPEQQSLLSQLQNAAHKGRSGSSHNAARQLMSTQGLHLPIPLPMATPDHSAINLLNWHWAATMEDLVVKGAGYPLENHKIITKDGFILNMYRIPHGKYRHTERGPKPVVLLQHGVSLSSNSFVLLNANESIAYVLADAGFDVWMSNTRGNTYCRGHLWKSESGLNAHYWRFGMDEMAMIDLPAQIDKVLAVTKVKKLAFVGHSQGSTLIYMLLSEKTEYNDKISVVVHMGPVTFIEYIRAPFLKAQPVVKSDQWLKNMAVGEFLAHRQFAMFTMPMCGFNQTFNEWCVQQINGMFYGPSVTVPNDEFMLVGNTWPSSVSTRNLEHWSQMYRDGVPRLQKYDFGNNCSRLLTGGGWPNSLHESCNMVKYGQNSPPEYNMGNIRAPQAFLLGTIDLMSVPEDVVEQQKRLQPGVVVEQKVYHRYAHMDFVWDRNTVYKADLADIMFRFAPGTY